MSVVPDEGLYLILCNQNGGFSCAGGAQIFKNRLLGFGINGRDAVRYKANCIGNMTYQEAADLAGWCGTSMVIPAHYDMFQGNLENPELFIDYMTVKYPMVRSKILHPGEIYEIIF